MTYALATLYVIWCGYVWTLRGGGFGAIVRKLFLVEPGTTITRIACAFLMAAPLAAMFDPALIVLWGSLYVAMVLGYFGASMGLERPGRDHLLLGAWGWVVALIATLPIYTRFDVDRFNPPAFDLFGIGPVEYGLNVLTSAIGALWFTPAADFAAVGVLAVAAYAINKPFGGHWTQRAEACMGLIMGGILYSGASTLSAAIIDTLAGLE